MATQVNKKVGEKTPMANYKVAWRLATFEHGCFCRHLHWEVKQTMNNYYFY